MKDALNTSFYINVEVLYYDWKSMSKERKEYDDSDVSASWEPLWHSCYVSSPYCWIVSAAIAALSNTTVTERYNLYPQFTAAIAYGALGIDTVYFKCRIMVHIIAASYHQNVF